MKSVIFSCVTMFLFFLSGCEDAAEAEEKQQGTHFLFYPMPNIYYDQDNKEYYFYDSTKANWQTAPSPPTAGDLGKSVQLDSVPVPVYRDNETHRLIHGAKLYSSPEELRRQYKEDSVASLPKKDTVAAIAKTDSAEVKKKSRIGRWLQKVFGKTPKPPAR